MLNTGHPHSLRGVLQAKLDVNGDGDPRAWLRKPVLGRCVEKASWLTMEPRMESSVAPPGQLTGA